MNSCQTRRGTRLWLVFSAWSGVLLLGCPTHFDMAMVQNQWYHFGIDAPPNLVYFSGDWDVHWGYGVLTHGHILSAFLGLFPLELFPCTWQGPCPVGLGPPTSFWGTSNVVQAGRGPVNAAISSCEKAAQWSLGARTWEV